jgi:transcriptional regulator of acetoin/glycerol metabolism
VPRPPADIDPDWLRERFKMPGATALEIAAEIGHHPSTVRRHARRLGIRMRVPWPDRSEFDQAWLRRRYVDERATIAQVAREAAVSATTVHRALRFHGISKPR